MGHGLEGANDTLGEHMISGSERKKGSTIEVYYSPLTLHDYWFVLPGIVPQCSCERA